MAYDKFLIASLEEGLRSDLKPWQIPDSAYAQLNNAYIFRGRLKKKIGSKYSGGDKFKTRLRALLGTTNGSGVLSGTFSDAIYKVGQQFSIGSDVITITSLGATAGFIATCAGTLALNTSTGVYTFTFASHPSTSIYYYPTEPVMGLCQYEGGTIHNQVAYAFDTRFAYSFSGNAWQKENTVKLTGTDSSFVWTYNWMGTEADEVVLFCTNNKDAMFYFQGNIATPAWTASWKPQFLIDLTHTDNYRITKAAIVIPFKNKLLVAGITESFWDSSLVPAALVENRYPGRVRYSGSDNPLNVNAFMEVSQTTWKGGG
jgi:hypothetical protein